MEFKEYVTREIGSFLWDAFTDADAVGVELDSLLTWPGLRLTQYQIFCIESHYDRPEEWTDQDEAVTDKIADATDSEEFESLYSWLAWAVGDQTAAELVEDWEA